MNSNLSSPNKKATLKEEWIEMKTYMFSDPDPVANISRIYPYFRFDNYQEEGTMRLWKMIVLENDYIKVYICPDIGGKVWGAYEKTTKKEFLYFNEVVKFRDVAMRGAWTSGGLEYNFGDIGHTPSCATPVDYLTKKNKDGSVSCIVGAIDLPSRTKWHVEICLAKDNAFFETKISWFNNTALPVTHYHWMNAAAKAKKDLEFIYPGNERIGHGGELGKWPIDNATNIAWYKNNNFGTYKSYHIINNYSDFFGGYWHDDDFGFGHYSNYDDKPGKKIWIWGLSDEGMIWEDLLTDSSGQYIEYQAGKSFSQAADSSSKTPFKHKEFTPYDSDISNGELWFPLLKTKGMVASSPFAVLNTKRNPESTQLLLSPLQFINTTLTVKIDAKKVLQEKINGTPLQLIDINFPIKKNKNFTVELGNKLLVYDSNISKNQIDRPTTSVEKFDWDTHYGLYIKGLELEKQRRYKEAFSLYQKSYKKEPNYIPTLNRLSLCYYKLDNLKESIFFAKNQWQLIPMMGLPTTYTGL